MKTNLKDNYYMHFNEEWLNKTEIPEGYSSWGSFEILDKKSTDDVRIMIDEIIQKDNPENEELLIKNLFLNYLNDEARNKLELKPLRNIFDVIDELNSKEDLTKLFTKLFNDHLTTFFHSISIDSDLKKSDEKAIYISTMSLGMSEKNFYKEDHKRHEEVKNAYKKFINFLYEKNKKLFTNKNIFDLVYDFENRISQSMFEQEELRSPENIYNEYTIQKLNEHFNFIDWDEYLSAIRLNCNKKIIVTQPNFFKALKKEIEIISVDQLKDLMKMRLLISSSSLSSIEYYNKNFEFRSVFSGIKNPKDKKQRATEFVDSLLGELIGKRYIKKYFSEEAKRDVLKIVRNLIDVYKKRIQNLDWMTDETKLKAIEKLDYLTIKIGYPDKWDDYKKIKIETYEQGSNLYENLFNIEKYFWEKELREIKNKVDKTKWHMSPQTVNAYYNPTSNEICFPAAILQKPFYDIKQSKAANLGGIGSVIGHEISHGFDDEGSKFDKDGNFIDWWSERDKKEYSLRTKKLANQFSQYQVDGSNVNGNLTLGENIGDLGGVNAALDVCVNICEEKEIKHFFENYALIWRRKSTKEKMNTRLLLDPHSPEEFRCNGVLVNIDLFYKIYDINENDKMWKDEKDRIKIW